MVLIVMGVAGAGKTTVGMLLAKRLGFSFHDADSLHSVENRRKMQRGIALTDDDRRPWLREVRTLVEDCLAQGTDAIVACSALRQSYRNLLVVDPESVRIVYLKGSRELIARRLATRHGHFFDPGLIDSQFNTLEEPGDAIVEEITTPAEVVVESIVTKLRSAVPPASGPVPQPSRPAGAQRKPARGFRYSHEARHRVALSDPETRYGR